MQSFYCVAEKDLIGYGKGRNAIISYLYNYLVNLPIKPKKLVLYCDNCVSQNKNIYILSFCHWIVFSQRLFEEVDINFLIPGHTKFSPDRHLGYAKMALNQSDNVETFIDAMQVISESAKKQIVKPTRNFNDDLQNVRVYNWKKFLLGKYSRPSSRLRLFTSHFFRVKRDNPKIEYRTYHDSDQCLLNSSKITKMLH